MNKLLNRNISHLQFNLRVADEAEKTRNHLAERVNFLGIAHSNLMEFLAVRYPAALQDDTQEDNEDLIKAIGDHYQTLIKRYHKFNKDHHIVSSISSLSKTDRKWADKYFRNNIFPALLPVTVDEARKAMIRDGLYLMVLSSDKDEEYIGYIEIPNCVDRFIAIPEKHTVIAVEDLVRVNIGQIIRGRKIIKAFPFAVQRSAEVFIQTNEYRDPYQLIEETLHEREKSWITMIEAGTDKKDCLKVLRKILPIEAGTLVFSTDRIRLADLKNIPSSIYKASEQMRKVKIRDTFPEENIMDYIKRKDRLCFHPYENYDTSVVKFLEEAAVDPDVVSIRISLYRVSSYSKIVAALLEAATKGKLVTVLVELKARFDERHNMEISRVLQEGGVRIIYTNPDIKTHAKVLLITRKEKKGLRIYSHIGTGNYSEANSRLYTDYSYFTADQEIGLELTQFFNLMTADQDNFKSKRIVYAPYNLKSTVIEQINHQIKLAKKKKPARITIKCNALTDQSVAKRLIDAANSGVKITLIIRSACIIQPQKNITIHSIVGQQLEHSRIYVFGSGKDSKIYIGSADLMTRNLSYRNELMILVEPRDLRDRILKHIGWYLRDNVNRRVILKGYSYESVKRKKGEKEFDCQKRFAEEAKELTM